MKIYNVSSYNRSTKKITVHHPYTSYGYYVWSMLQYTDHNGADAEPIFNLANKLNLQAYDDISQGMHGVFCYPKPNCTDRFFYVTHIEDKIHNNHFILCETDTQLTVNKARALLLMLDRECVANPNIDLSLAIQEMATSVAQAQSDSESKIIILRDEKPNVTAQPAQENFLSTTAKIERTIQEEQKKIAMRQSLEKNTNIENQPLNSKPPIHQDTFWEKFSTKVSNFFSSLFCCHAPRKKAKKQTDHSPQFQHYGTHRSSTVN